MAKSDEERVEEVFNFLREMHSSIVGMLNVLMELDEDDVNIAVMQKRDDYANFAVILHKAIELCLGVDLGADALAEMLANKCGESDV